MDDQDKIHFTIIMPVKKQGGINYYCRISAQLGLDLSAKFPEQVRMYQSVKLSLGVTAYEGSLSHFSPVQVTASSENIGSKLLCQFLSKRS